LSRLAENNLPIAKKWEAVEGLAGAATLYTIFGIIFTLFLGGKTFFGLLAILLDICFIGAFVAVAWFTRHGANSCHGFVQTPLGNGQSDSNSPGYGANGFGFGSNANATYAPSLRLACRFNTVVFAVSIIAIFLFLVSAVWQILMIQHHKKEKRYGPSPSNNYTSGEGRRPFWKRNKTRHTTKDAEAATLGAATVHHASRPSHETSTTIGNNAYASEPKYGEAGYGQTATPAHHGHGHGHGHGNVHAPTQAGLYESQTGTYAHNHTTATNGVF